MNDESGERFVLDLLPLFSQHGICFDFIEKFPQISFSSNFAEMIVQGVETYQMVMNSTANVIIVQGKIETMILLRMLLEASVFEDIPQTAKVWIMTAEFDFTSLPFQSSWDIELIHGTISFAVHSKEVLGFQSFLQNRSPNLEKENDFLRIFWEHAFKCSFSNSEADKNICTGAEKLETLPGSVFERRMTSHSYNIYNAVHMVARSLHTMYSSRIKRRGMEDSGRATFLNQQMWQVTPRVAKLSGLAPLEFCMGLGMCSLNETNQKFVQSY